jgi:hypothetical protein
LQIDGSHTALLDCPKWLTVNGYTPDPTNDLSSWVGVADKQSATLLLPKQTAFQN